MARLARAVIGAWELGPATLKPLGHGENATFRVDAAEGPFLLRIHRHGYHSREALLSEIEWLRFARSRSLPVPEPIRAKDDWLVRFQSDAVPHPRHCSLLRYQPGRILWRKLRPVQARRIGAMIAELHDAADAFVPSPSFVRPALDIDGCLRGGFGNIDDVPWLTEAQRHSVDRAEPWMREQLAQLQAEAPLLVHGDLHLGNILHHRGRARAIDFDDMGWGTISLDLAVPWSLFRRDPAMQDAIVEGYASRRELPGELEPRLKIWTLARQLSVLAWVADRQDVADLASSRTPVTERVVALCEEWVR